jgi:tetratricopeptide (TPR) repeat protein
MPVNRTLGDKSNVLPTADQQSALIVLDQLFEAAKGFEDDRLRIRTQARIADMLWPYDEPRARRQFEESFRAVMSAKTASPNGLAPPGGAFMQTSSLSELQSEVLALVSRRDADLAEKLIKSVADNSPDKEAGTNAQAGAEQKARRDLYLQAALSIVESDPGRAAQLAKAGLGGEISPEILKILFALRSSNPAAADDLFGAALAVARRDGRRASMNIATLAPYVLPEFTTMGAGTGSTQKTGATLRAAPPLVREFLNFTYDTFLQLSGVAAQLGLPGANYAAATPNPMDYMTGQRLLPAFIRYMPDKAMTFRQAVDAVARNMSQSNVVDAVGKMLQPGGADELLEQAKSEQNKFLKDLLYTRAAMSAMTGGDFDRALSIVEKLGDEDRRANLGSLIRLQAATAALKKEDLDSALRYTAGVSDLRQRAYLCGMIARALLDKNDAERAVEVLNDAERDIDKADDDAVKANALLIIAESKSRIAPAQGFEAVGVAVKAFNHADNAEGNKGRESSPAGGNLALSSLLNSTLKLDAPNFDPVFFRLAKVDFNRTMQLARALERKDRSVLAQLAACHGVLVTEHEKRGRISVKVK